MKIEKLWFYVAGLVMGVALAGSIALWAEVSIVYRVGFLVLLGLLFLATWSKPKSYKGDDNANSNHLDIAICKTTDKSSNSTTQS